MAIDRRTLKLLWGRAGNRCSFPDCGAELSVPGNEGDADAIIGEICHIVAGRRGGPRGASRLAMSQRDKTANLILLCPTHHSLIDAQKRRFTPTRLRKMKAEHELWVRQTLSASQHPATAARTPALHLPLPADYVPTEQFHAAKKVALREAATLAFVGGPGAGKSTLAAALCHDPSVRAAYPDGTLWITLGSERTDLTSTLVDVIEVLSGTRPGFQGVAAAAAHLRALVGDRRMLVVLDDVWESSQIDPFLDGYASCCRIVTARSSSVAPPDSHRVRIGAMHDAGAVRLLGHGLPEPDAGDGHTLLPLAKRLGGWPFLLKLANSALRQRVFDAHQPLSAALVDLARALDAAGVTAIDDVPGSERNASVARTLDVSIDRLTPGDRMRLAELSIFAEDDAIPLSEIGLLWKTTAGLDAAGTTTSCLRLFDRSMVTNLDLAAHTLTLHDLVRQYLRDTYRDQLRTWNLQLLDALGDWRHFDTGMRYRWRRLAYHLSAAGEEQRLRELLSDGHWLRAKLDAAGISDVIEDFSYVENDDDFACVRDALRLSSEALAADSAQLASQLYGRLSGLGNDTVRRILDTAAFATREAWLRPRLPRLTSPRSPLVLNLSTGTAQWGREDMTALAISDDARLAVSGSANGMVRLWNLREPQPPTTFTTEAGWVRAVALDSSNRSISAVSSGSPSSTGKRAILQTWDVVTQRLISRTTWPAGEGVPAEIKITDRALIDTGGGSRAGVIAIGRRSRKLTADWSVSAAAITSDGTRAAITDLNSNVVRFLDVVENRQDSSMRVGQWVSALAVTNDFTRLLAGYMNGTLKLWDVRTRKKIATIEGHIGAVQAAAMTPDGRYAIAASNSGTFALWDLRRGDHRKDRGDHRDSVTEITCSASGDLVLSGDYEGHLKTWNAKTGEVLRTVRAHQDQVTGVALLQQGSLTASCSRDGSIAVRDTETFKITHSRETDDVPVCDMTVLDDRYLVCGTWFGNVAVLDVISGESGFAKSENPTSIVRVVPTGRSGEVALAYEIGLSQLFNIFTATFGDTISGKYFASSAGADRIVSISWKKGDAELRDELTGRPLCTLRCGNNWFRDLLVDDSLTFAYSCNDDRSLRVWDLKTAKCIATYVADTLLTGCAIDQEGRRIVAGDASGRVHFLDLVNG